MFSPPALATSLVVFWTLLGLNPLPGLAQGLSRAKANVEPRSVPLSVDKGVPLRVIMTKRLRFRVHEPVHARTVEAVFAFDREVVPSGTEVLGRIKSLDPVRRGRRVAAILGGDLTPLRDPRIEFDSLILKDGRRIPIETEVTPGSGTVVRFDSAKAHKGGRLAAAKQTIRDQVGARKRDAMKTVKAPGKLQRLSDMLLARLPYHPQSWPAGTSLNAGLLVPLNFGVVAIPVTQLVNFAAQPSGENLVHARLTTDLDSRTATVGMPVEALLSQPLFAGQHQLLFPVGSRLLGTVAQVRSARLWHRNGQLRFAFQQIELPLREQSTEGTWQVESQLESVAVGGTDKVAMDSEGGTRVASSKARFIAPVLTMMLAGRGLDSDRARLNGAPTGAIQSNAGGQAVAGAVGFGLIGAAVAQVSRPVSAVIGFYGAAWSIYSNIVGPGHNVKFPRDTPIEVRFATRGQGRQ